MIVKTRTWPQWTASVCALTAQIDKAAVGFLPDHLTTSNYIIKCTD